ncbi:MAG TPA: response regulator transcription factor [Vicinamibacteria bacterium]|nr:response regulator transcription factor [Vicinamibacteria bacterium]
MELGHRDHSNGGAPSRRRETAYDAGDPRLPDMDGVDALLAIRRLAPAARVVFFTSFGGREDVYRSVRAGASGYLLKDAQREELMNCIRTVHAGGSWISPVAAARLTARLGEPDLTPRERDVLHIALGTTKAHVNRILGKLNVGSRSEAVATALRRSIVALDPR